MKKKIIFLAVVLCCVANIVSCENGPDSGNDSNLNETDDISVEKIEDPIEKLLNGFEMGASEAACKIQEREVEENGEIYGYAVESVHVKENDYGCYGVEYNWSVEDTADAGVMLEAIDERLQEDFNEPYETYDQRSIWYYGDYCIERSIYYWDSEAEYSIGINIENTAYN